MNTYLLDMLSAAKVTNPRQEVNAARTNGFGIQNYGNAGLYIEIDNTDPTCVIANVSGLIAGVLSPLAHCWQSAESFGMYINTEPGDPEKIVLNSTGCCEACSYEYEFLVAAAGRVTQYRQQGVAADTIELLVILAAATAQHFGLNPRDFPRRFKELQASLAPAENV